MAKNIVVCMDGTGNYGAKARGTNVWRIYNAVDRHNKNCEQIVYYDDGVGTENLRLLRLIAGAFGFGLSRKIRDAYTFLVMNHKDGDQIFLFGFSRGAFAVRSLASMICRCGLLERNAFLESPRRIRQRTLMRVLAAYRSEKRISRDEREDETETANIRRCLGVGDLPMRTVPIEFLGVWDTVDAVGGTFGGLSLLDGVSRWLFGKRWWGFHDLDPHPDIRHAYQALALDDERRTFHPKVWSRSNNGLAEMPASPAGEASKAVTGQVVEQVWFAGVHSNVGGGYPKDALSLVPLLWMMCRAQDCGLRFVKRLWKEFTDEADAHGRMYDSRAGLRWFYRYGRRELHCQPELPAIHESVFQRIERGTEFYGPKLIDNDGYVVVLDDFAERYGTASGGTEERDG